MIAPLMPYAQKKRSKRPMLDLTARLKKVFGKRMIPDHAMKAILDQDRGIR